MLGPSEGRGLLDKVGSCTTAAPPALPNSPAQAAGLKVNDVILQVDGTTIKNENHMINLISALPAGQKIRVQFWRERKLVTTEVVVGDWNRVPKVMLGRAEPGRSASWDYSAMIDFFRSRMPAWFLRVHAFAAYVS